MGFMQPSTSFERFLRVEQKSGESYIVPAAHYQEAVNAALGGDTVEDLGETWGVRLSAPGYMDCTDWSAPFATEEAALDHLAETFDLCRECFEDSCEAESAEACRAKSENES